MPSRYWFREEDVQLPKRYRPIEPIGQGAFGLVFSVLDLSDALNPKPVAIKKINITSLSSARHVFHEIAILRQHSHENVLALTDVIVPSGTLREVYLVSELMDTDLGSVLKSDQVLSQAQVQLIFCQLMRGLEYLHAMKVVHRDIKPRNLLLGANCDLKICDFGLAKICPSDASRMTDYVCTRWYRAPEILLGALTYGPPADIFSAGCVLGEMVGRKPLLPGANSERQLVLILERFGKVPADQLGFEPQGCLRPVRDAYCDSSTGDLESYIQSSECDRPASLTLLRKLCMINPGKRLTASETLAVDWFGSLTYLPTQEVPTARYKFVERLRGDMRSISDRIRREAKLVRDTKRPAIEIEVCSFDSQDDQSESTSCWLHSPYS